MSISTLLRENNIELYLTTSSDGIKITNIPNNFTTDIQSASINQYTLLLPSIPSATNDILAVDTIIGDKVFLKWANAGSGQPELPTDVINCDILNATQEVNTSELTISSQNPLTQINTTFSQPDSIDVNFDVKIFLPNNEITMLTNDSLLYVSSSILIPGTPNTIELTLDYTKTLPEFNIDVFSTLEFTLKNVSNQRTNIIASPTQSTSIIELILPENQPNVGEILASVGNNQLSWVQPGNALDKFKVESLIINANTEINSTVPFYSRVYPWSPSIDSPSLIYCCEVQYIIQKTNPTGSFSLLVQFDLIGTTIVSGINIKNYGSNYSDLTLRYETIKFFFKNPSTPNQNVSFTVTTDIGAGGTLLLSRWSYNIYPVGFE